MPRQAQQQAPPLSTARPRPPAAARGSANAFTESRPTTALRPAPTSSFSPGGHQPAALRASCPGRRLPTALLRDPFPSRTRRRLAGRPGHLVRRAHRRRARRRRRRLRVQERQPAALLRHDLLRQRAALQGRQGMRLMLPDPVRGPEPPGVLGRAGDGDHHGHELLPCLPLPLRPQRHRLRRHGPARPQRPAPTRRHHRHAVQEGAVPVPRADGDVPRAARVEPVLPGDPGGVRERRRRRGPGGHHGVAAGPRRQQRGLRDGADGGVGADEGVVGVHLADGLPAALAGALLAAHHQRVGADARRRPGHPRRLGAQPNLQLHHPVRLIMIRMMTLIHQLAIYTSKLHCYVGEDDDDDFSLVPVLAVQGETSPVTSVQCRRRRSCTRVYLLYVVC